MVSLVKNDDLTGNPHPNRTTDNKTLVAVESRMNSKHKKWKGFNSSNTNLLNQTTTHRAGATSPTVATSRSKTGTVTSHITNKITTTQQGTTSSLGPRPDTPNSVSSRSLLEWSGINRDGVEEGAESTRRTVFVFVQNGARQTDAFVFV
ncbi:hypothetical protein RHGRI_031574 [Rhododendron griersonianum]|uniref:Uncharacterized protein n=1 Tax=Rhododendron griersonianum TaxID=479676 RepID=A0AAV6IAR2_9ERIC|nr:hypothetical protein RHGRI_031574 [Rhododendron griersonianum]